MKPILSILFILALQYQVSSQVQAVWKGGTPGQEKNWHTASNWSTNQVPNEFTDIIIQLDETFKENYPVIRQEKSEIHSIWIHRGAKVNLSSSGALKINSWEYSLFDKNQIVCDYHFTVDKSANIFLTRAQ